MTGKDRSEVVEALINQHLRRFVVSDRGNPESHKAGITESDEQAPGSRDEHEAGEGDISNTRKQ
jgi:hypothetical protein